MGVAYSTDACIIQGRGIKKRWGLQVNESACPVGTRPEALDGLPGILRTGEHGGWKLITLASLRENW